MKKDSFKMADLPIESRDTSISKDDFKFVKTDGKIHDKKFNTKPTTFLKDCFKRFCKNKSSVVAAIILGVLLVMSILVPGISELTDSTGIRSTRVPHTEINYLEPKLFDKGDFWSGKKKYSDVPINVTTGLPDPDDFDASAISDLKITDEKYTTFANKLANGGYSQYSVYQNAPDDFECYISPSFTPANFDFNQNLTLKSFVVYDENDLLNSSELTKDFPVDYVSAESELSMKFDKNTETHTIVIDEFKKSHKIGVNGGPINITEIFNEYAVSEGFADKTVNNLRFNITIKGIKNENACALIKSFEIGVDDYEQVTIEKVSDDNSKVFIAHTANNTEVQINSDTNITGKTLFIKLTDKSSAVYKGVLASDDMTKLLSFSFKSGNDLEIRKDTTVGYWANYADPLYCGKKIYLARATLASFTYDTYQDALGTTYVDIPNTFITEYKNKGYIKLTFTTTLIEGVRYPNEATFSFKILNDDKCPIVGDIGINDIEFEQSSGKIKSVHAKVVKYRYYYGLDTMPKFLLGTDVSGRDMFVYVFEGLRTSLLLGLCTTIVCFIFGLIWGSVSGYFGGAVDLIMERITDILSGIPWIVVMTLVILKVGKSSFLVFALALCLTGWIGTAATTRTQFYRFRGREYVLASRTLGASNARLISKHILPNALGTIITSAVLMVPSVIFSEATLSYLGLAKLGDGDTGLSSLGVILSDNQIQLTNHPYLLIFPSIIIALLMISFNLFGNGLRDAVNPSLKGEGE